MKPAAFQYHAPKTLDEAVRVLGQVAPEDGRVLAGGQSLVPTMAFRMARPAHLVDINGIAELDVLAASDASLTIGAASACCIPQACGGGAARSAALGRGAAHCALSDSHPRDVLREHRACRSGLGMVPGSGDARRDRDGAEHPRNPYARRGVSFRRLYDHQSR